jgi:hypothetical protein
MPKPVTPQEMFDLWQKMVNPGAYPLQGLMFPVLDPKELEKKIGELEIVEHWLKANVNMVQLTIKSLQFQRAMLKGGEAAADVLKNPGATDGAEDVPNPASWPWSFMAAPGNPSRQSKPSPQSTQSTQRTPRKRKRPE